MSKTIQLQGVPDAVHRKLKTHAATQGLSLSEYLIREITQIAEQPTMEEALAEIAKLPMVNIAEPSAVTIRSLTGKITVRPGRESGPSPYPRINGPAADAGKTSDGDPQTKLF